VRGSALMTHILLKSGMLLLLLAMTLILKCKHVRWPVPSVFDAVGWAEGKASGL